MARNWVGWWGCVVGGLTATGISVLAQEPAPPQPASPYGIVRHPAPAPRVIVPAAGQLRASDSAVPIPRPIESSPDAVTIPDFVPASETALLMTPVDPPPGFTGRSGVIPREVQRDGDFVPVEDRWRIGFPYWDRYDQGFPLGIDYPYKLGHWWDPYNQNVIKGDFPIVGQNTFFNLTATSISLVDTRQTPIGTTPFESTANPLQEEFFGSPNQLAYLQFLRVSGDLFHGDTNSFKPIDWRVKITGVFNANTLNVSELAVVNPNVLKGVQRERTFLALEEYFLETKLADVSPNYDFVSARIGSQFFNNDFKGFLFVDTNRAVRLFGNRLSNQQQYNLAFFRQAEKDTNTGLNTQIDRGQHVLLANYYHQDFIWPGYTAQISAVYNHDNGQGLKFDTNSFLVRPDAVGTFQPHTVDVVYLGWAGDGHIERYNITHQMYYALGRDTQNPLANQGQDISAAFGAVEVSYDRDWMRFRTSFMWASGDHNINNSHATGFDSIFANPNFAGGQFSYWQRQAIRLFGVNLVQAGNFLPDLRSSRIQGQSNFVNPGLFLFNAGFDMDLTPKLKLINNANLLWFESTDVLRQFVYAGGINSFIGTDLSMGVEYRPLLNNNIILTTGVSGLIPGSGFKALYNRKESNVDPQVAAFMELVLTY